MNEWLAIPLVVILILGPIGVIAGLLPVAASRLRRRGTALDDARSVAWDRVVSSINDGEGSGSPAYQRAFDDWARLALRPGATL